MRDSSTRLAVLLALVLFGSLTRAARREPSPGGSTPPNVIVIVGDDLGWNDMSWNGAPTIMPNLERLALEGVRLERFYTAPVCSPTRMALLTGRYPIRWGMQRGVVKPDSERGMPRSEEILPEMLADNGYAASHVTGKWHLGQRFSKYHPLRAGFGGFLGNYTGAIDYYSKIRGTYDWHRDFDDDTNYTDYHTDLVGDEAANFIAAHENEPFVLYVPFLAGHNPQQAPAALVAAYSTSLSLDRRIHLAQITSMDTNIGKILDELDTRDLTDNTIVWFLSDNGGTSFFGGSNTPLRNGKGSVYDGGIRTPSVVRYPDGGLPANTLVDELVSHVDILPTLRGFIANAAGPLQPTVRTLDGIDMSAFLAGTASGSPPAKEHFTIRDQYFDDALPPDYSLVRYDPSLDKLWKLLWLGEEFDLAAYEGGTTGATIKLYDLSLNPGEDDAQLVVDPILEASLVAGLGAWVDLAPPDAGYTQDTSGWFAIPNYAFRDLPTPCDELLVLYAGAASSNFQRLASIDPATGTITTFNETRNLPDGMDDLDLQGIGRSPIDGLVYAITTDGQEVYQLDGSELAGYGVPGVLLHLGSTTGIPPGASITAGDVSPDGSLYVVFDDANDIIYAIELRNLVATATSVGFTGAVQLADMAFDSAGSLRAYEESQDRVLTIDPSGNVSASPHTYPLGSTGAVWIDDNDDLIVWKRETDKVILIGTPAYQRGLYHLELATGAITLLTTVPKTWRIDGAGCLSGP